MGLLKLLGKKKLKGENAVTTAANLMLAKAKKKKVSFSKLAALDSEVAEGVKQIDADGGSEGGGKDEDGDGQGAKGEGGRIEEGAGDVNDGAEQGASEAAAGEVKEVV